MSILAALIATNLATAINSFAKKHSLGRAVSEGLFILAPPATRIRRPDVAFVSFQRWGAAKPLPLQENAWDVVPDLAIEVISPSDLAEEVMEKVEEYFRAGVQQVWVVCARRRLVHMYESLQHIRGLTAADDLLGGAILPGFSLPLKMLFEP
jgi:Uma2 family endonuclease